MKRKERNRIVRGLATVCGIIAAICGLSIGAAAYSGPASGSLNSPSGQYVYYDYDAEQSPLSVKGEFVKYYGIADTQGECSFVCSGSQIATHSDSAYYTAGIFGKKHLTISNKM